MTKLKSVLTLAAALVVTSHASAGTTSSKEVPPVIEATKKSYISGEIGFDITNAYFFQGLRQQDNGFIFQPYAYLSFTVYEGTGFLSSLSLDLGNWNSFHSNRGDTGSSSHWFESDMVFGLTATLDEKWAVSASFKRYTSPGDHFTPSNVLTLEVSYDDKDLLGPFSLQPYLLLEWEIHNKSANGSRRGVSYEAGVEPSMDFGPVNLSLPLRVGLGSHDYYAGDEGFGYFSAGVTATYGLTFIPESLGEWSISANATYMNLGDGTAVDNDGDHDVWIFTSGLKVTF